MVVVAVSVTVGVVVVVVVIPATQRRKSASCALCSQSHFAFIYRYRAQLGTAGWLAGFSRSIFLRFTTHFTFRALLFLSDRSDKPETADDGEQKRKAEARRERYFERRTVDQIILYAVVVYYNKRRTQPRTCLCTDVYVCADTTVCIFIFSRIFLFLLSSLPLFAHLNILLLITALWPPVQHTICNLVDFAGCVFDSLNFDYY